MGKPTSRGKLYDDQWRRAPDAGIERLEFETILEWVSPGSKVLDLGCGDGSLGSRLIEEKDCRVWGVDVSGLAVNLANKKGVVAQVGDLDHEKLPFEDGFFDYVILCDVLEHVFFPKKVLEEAKRLTRESLIVAAPNVAYWSGRLDLLRDYSPRAPLFGFNWYDSDHVTLFSYGDFLKLIQKIGLKVERKHFIAPHRIEKISFLKRVFPGLFALVFVAELRRFERVKTRSA
ncbi:MAG: methionine biosynthesis protein MetW [Actinomycetota bacterium]|nr:methionine biosynthesis protein MetW [Actinomycetota bacterium]